MNSGSQGRRRVSPISPPCNTVPLQPLCDEKQSSGSKEAQMGPIVEEAKDEEKEGGRRPIVSQAPERPTEQEVREHNVTHTPPQAWCPHCVKGAGTNSLSQREKKGSARC